MARAYKQPISSIQKTRAMRMINGVRDVIVKSAVEADQLDIENDPKGQEQFVHNHQRLQKELAGHFPFVDIRGDQYASDIAAALAKDIVFFILHGDTPGGG